MLSLPLYILLIAYAIFLIIFFIFFITNLLHIIFTGTTTFSSFIATFIVMTLTALTIYGTWYYLQNTDWAQPVTLFDASWITSLFKSGGVQYF